MKVVLLKKDILADKSDVLLVMAPSKNGKMVFSPKIKALDRRLGGLLAAGGAGFSAESGQILSFPAARANWKRIIFVGQGEESAQSAAMAVSAAVESLKKSEKILTVLCSSSGGASAIITAAAAGAYRFRLGAARPQPALAEIRAAATITAAEVARCAAVGEGIRLTRHLAEQPGNICTPSFLARLARDLGGEFSKLKTKILNEKEMKTLKMGALLAVAKGSAEPPKMITMQYKGAAGAPIVLVGKGVTFDSGGISLKPAAAMDEMKFDMGGAAAVFGAMLACVRMKLPLHVVAVVPSCENMPGGQAVKPGDVIRAMNGKTIEVLNTDAEGRLILADALSYCARYKPAAVVDAATLTGACVIALGRHLNGMMSADDGLAGELSAAGAVSGDECWRLPLGGKYNSQLKSAYADLANIGGREAGATTAACFLSNFTEGQKWAHLDIAGTAWDAKKRATGRPAPLLAQFLIRRAGKRKI